MREHEPARAHGERLGRLFAESHEPVWRFLRRLGLGAAAADDAAQDAFLVVARRLGDIEPGRERAFLFGTALRVAAHARRAAARLDAGDETLHAIAACSPKPDEVLARSQALTLCERVLGAMPEELRAVFILAELDEETGARIASRLSLPQGTVASRLRRARAMFAELTAEREGNQAASAVGRPSKRSRRRAAAALGLMLPAPPASAPRNLKLSHFGGVAAAIVLGTGLSVVVGLSNRSPSRHAAVPASVPSAVKEAAAPTQPATASTRPQSVETRSRRRLVAPTRPAVEGIGQARASDPVPVGRGPEVAAEPRSIDDGLSSLTAQTTLLDAAREALGRGAPRAALLLLERYRREFPTGEFQVEVEALRIEALLYGDRALGARLGARFLAEHPESSLAPHLRTLLNGGPEHVEGGTR
jgi:RNA polymerase sigma-70 factor (ECF subfamily)